MKRISAIFGTVLRRYRLQRGWTQEHIAERAGIHPTYVGMVERGERNCSLDVAADLAGALAQPLSTLIEEAETMSAALGRRKPRGKAGGES